MDIRDLREEIDGIDAQIVELFIRRMAVSAKVARYKRAHNLPIHVPARELEILDAVGQKAGTEMGEYAKALYATIFELSRDYQTKQNSGER